ncbi:hypothetical protein GCM10028804_29610 [Larkinella terrae]|uniref:Helix-turn-helix domain-containing protein n=2 Tax=Larkinella terrae TaxID=2025311 RepID=A0A7K0EFB5_9BACT|nr:helix-turn-helix domain-containing protein [Larkinella terrae]
MKGGYFEKPYACQLVLCAFKTRLLPKPIVMPSTPKKQPIQLYERYLQLIQTHLTELVKEKTDTMLDIQDFADQLCIHPIHLSTTIKEVTGLSACGVFQLEIVKVARQLLLEPDRKVKEVALILDFEPSQFTKWFKRISGTTPKAFQRERT